MEKRKEQVRSAVAKHDSSMREKGLRPLKVYVPSIHYEKLKRIASKITEKYLKGQ